ncbi:MAG: orotate phosphoribosyltransferase [Patescibacteria group bacterium]|nr:orotate phosphoribosyltransferase [Patescibacteria group bacterium]MDD4610491.1 orotate phosphoribosyltransferase [Patescibacteria group bacterium]
MERDVARTLLTVGAVILNLTKPFRFRSGILSPIYTDNRKLLGYVGERDSIATAMVDAVKNMDFEVVVGTATAGIPWATLVAERLGLPLAYCRAEEKDHGLGKKLEGADVVGKKVLVIEDLISSGGSSGKVIENCREAGAIQVKLVAIFTYQLKKADETFARLGCDAVCLTNFPTLAEVASEMGLISAAQIGVLKSWSEDPVGWAEKNRKE